MCYRPTNRAPSTVHCWHQRVTMLLPTSWNSDINKFCLCLMTTRTSNSVKWIVDIAICNCWHQQLWIQLNCTSFSVDVDSRHEFTEYNGLTCKFILLLRNVPTDSKAVQSIRIRIRIRRILLLLRIEYHTIYIFISPNEGRQYYAVQLWTGHHTHTEVMSAAHTFQQHRWHENLNVFCTCVTPDNTYTQMIY